MDQQTPIEPTQTIEWLNNLIMLAQYYDRKLPFHVVVLLNEQTEYQAFLARVRASDTATAQLTDTSSEPTLIAAAQQKLLNAVATVPAIRKLFGSDQDPFKDAPPDHLELLAEVSDVTPNSQRMVSSRNGTLGAVMDAMRSTGDLDPNPLIVDWLSKYLVLLETPLTQGEASTAEMLYELATSPHWYLVMASLRADRDYTRDEPEVAGTLKRWNEMMANQHLKKLLADHLSRAPKKLIRLAWEHREIFAEGRANIPESAREKLADDERKQVANSAFLLLEEKFKPQIDDIKSDLKVLATVASHFVNVRKFAKFDGFVYTWPDIARLGTENFGALKYVEELLLNRRLRPTDADLDAHDARELYSRIDNDERLKRFMRIRPHFGEISGDELMHYRPLAPLVVTAGRPGSGGLESVDVVSQPQQPGPMPQPQTKALQVQTLSIQPPPDFHPSEQGTVYDISFAMLGKTITGSVSFAVEKLLEKILFAMGVSSDSGLQEILKELFATDPTFAEERIRRGSVELAMNVLPMSIDPLSEVLATPPSLRLIIDSPDRDIHYLPWEWWPTSMSTLLLSSSDHSVVRSFKSSAQNLPTPILPPLHLLSLIPNAPRGRRFTSDITVKALQEIASANNVQYFPVVRQEPTLGILHDQIEKFKPNIVHWEGYVDVVTSSKTPHYEPAENALQIVLSGSPNDVIEIEQFGSLLKANGVQLLVIGRNAVSRIYENTCASAAFALAQQGISVIAPLRAIDELSATTFTTEFYRAFLAGNKLETAMHIARRNLASKGGDWTAFALFTDPDRLQYLELVRQSA